MLCMLSFRKFYTLFKKVEVKEMELWVLHEIIRTCGNSCASVDEAIKDYIHETATCEVHASKVRLTNKIYNPIAFACGSERGTSGRPTPSASSIPYLSHAKSRQSSKAGTVDRNFPNLHSASFFPALILPYLQEFGINLTYPRSYPTEAAWMQFILYFTLHLYLSAR